MLQRTSLPTTANSDIAVSLQRTFKRGWVQALRDTLQLPSTWQQYLLFFVIVVIVGAGMAVQVVLSVQIAETTLATRTLHAEYERVERENAELIFQIATRMSLNQVRRAANEQGFVPATGRTYVFRNQLAGAPVQGLGSEAAAADAITALDGGKKVSSAVQSPKGPLDTLIVHLDDLTQGWQQGGSSMLNAVQQAIDQLARDIWGRVR